MLIAYLPVTLSQADPRLAVARLLARSLHPRDLVHASGIDPKLRAIAEDAGLYPSIRAESGWLTRVGRTDREWVAILGWDKPRGNISADAGFWIGVIGGKVVVSLLPDDPRQAAGPLCGTWRKRGKLRLGVGADVAYHSLRFITPDVLVFEVGPTGLVLRQRLRPPTDDPPRFVGRGSDDVLTVRQTNEMLALQPSRDVGLMRQTRYAFQAGRFRVSSSKLVYDDVWALDRLANAMVRNDFSVIRRLAPNPQVRRAAIRSLWECLGKGEVIVERNDGTGALGLRRALRMDGASPVESRFAYEFAEVGKRPTLVRLVANR